MYRALRKRFTPSTLIATLALVFAMSGGAYAAGKYLITSTKQISPKVLKSLTGKAGPAGKDGTNGTNGAAGAQGPAGAKGENGAPGTNGTNGKDGVSVTSTVLAAKNANCKEGGSEFKAGASTTFACNGKEGKEGTFGGQTLPSGKTLRGVWALAGYAQEAFPKPKFGSAYASATFSLPVEGEIKEAQAEYIPAETEPVNDPEGCEGSYAEPKAAPGYLCVFAHLEENVIQQHAEAISISSSGEPLNVGLVVKMFGAAEGRFQGYGTWAVTAP